MLNKQWSIYPDMAMKFAKYKKALKLLKDLQLQDRAILVAAFDCAPGIQIAA
ncbi:hypothetical protein MACH09_14450 [Vibrio sp. MACH09]|nr:hypothetical protein [Vibrio sp. MACH09]GLO60937.1 hypothetical protein MACH09_14450 [Vibrio sp. MACH09]